MKINRRQFTAAIAAASLSPLPLVAAEPARQKIKLGLVTYNWGKSWDIPTLIRNCTETHFAGVELRSTHKHGVEPTLSKSARQQVRKQFADSAVELVGLGSACEYHSPDPKVVARNIEQTKAFVKLCHDVGGHGVKVRPNGIPKDVPLEKTLAQIGASLRTVGKFAADYGVKIRLEVHGRGTQELPYIKTMMDAADHPNAVVCWNCNPTDLTGKGLNHNFDVVKKNIEIIHIHDLRSDQYPWKRLFGLLKSADFDGWTLLEEGKTPTDIVAAMHENHKVWKQLVKQS